MPYLIPPQPHKSRLMQFPVHLTAAGKLCRMPHTRAADLQGFPLQHKVGNLICQELSQTTADRGIPH